MDDEQKAVIAAANGEPLPEGWAKISGTLILEAIERQNRIASKRGRKLGKGKSSGSVPDLQKTGGKREIDVVHGESERGSSDLSVCFDWVDQGDTKDGRVPASDQGEVGGMEAEGDCSTEET